jgi:hypothetical protein
MGSHSYRGVPRALQESISLGLNIDMEVAQSMIEYMCSKMNIEYHQEKTISRE